MKKSLFVTLIICVLLAVFSTVRTGCRKDRLGSARERTYKYKVNNTYVKNEVKK